MILLIPAYEPGSSLVDLVREARECAPRMTVLVIDDGSGPVFDDVFSAAESEGAEVIRYGTNRGKGRALRTGIRHVIERFPGEAVVTADSDGQHSLADISRVADRVCGGSAPIVLGGRRFAGDVPARSRFGNTVSRVAFRAATGVSVHDTQTGLRGFAPEILRWLLAIPGDRFDYELNVLLRATSERVGIDEIPIQTIYLEHNASSHFRPVVDSVRVMRPLMAFGLVSLASFVLDVVMLELFFWLSSSLLFSVIGARVTSGSANFVANRALVFRSRAAGAAPGVRKQALRYAALAVSLVAASYGSIVLLTSLGLPLLPAKLITDASLYLVSFQVQRHFVFAGRRSTGAAREPQRIAAGVVSR